MGTQAVLSDCEMSLVDDIERTLNESRVRHKEKEEQKRIIEKARQFIRNTADGEETMPSPQEAHLRFLRLDFHQKLADAVEELTVVTLAAVLEADRQLQIWRREIEAPSRSQYVSKAHVPGKDMPMPSVFRVNIEDRQAIPPVFLPKRPDRRLGKRKLREQRSDAIFFGATKGGWKNCS